VSLIEVIEGLRADRGQEVAPEGGHGQEVDGQEVDASKVERQDVNSKADPCPQTFGMGMTHAHGVRDKACRLSNDGACPDGC
jgi:hypothetical protein